MSPLKTLFRVYVIRHWISFTAASCFLIITNYLTVSIPSQIGLAIDNFSTGNPMQHIINIFWMGAVIVVVRTLSRVLFFNPARDIEYQIRQDIFVRLLALQPTFYSLFNRGDIISRASNDITWTRIMIGFGGLQLINVFFAVVLTGWKMVEISFLLSVLAIVPILIGFVIVNIVIRRLYPLMLLNQQQLSRISEHVLESLQGIASIQSFGAQDAFEAKFRDRNEAWFKTGMRLAVLRSFFAPLIAFAAGGSLFMIIYFGGPMVVNEDDLSIGDLAALIALVATLVPYMRSIGWMLSVWQRGKASLERIFELMDAHIERPELQLETIAKMTSGKGPAISIRNLSFSYPNTDKKVLKNISIDIPTGATVGIFGRTAAGKSTLLKLISRSYNPPTETIFVDGFDIGSLDLLEWRRRISVVSQRSFLFSESITSNISFEKNPDEERLQRAIEMASLTQDLPALPNGVNTIVGERGIMLSGGQRQRVALARGLYLQGDLLLLDDVLSAVDHENEHKLVQTLSALSKSEKQLTCVIVSNRISAFRHADFIVVLEDGEVQSTGSHEQLIAAPGIYQQAYLAQQEDSQ